MECQNQRWLNMRKLDYLVLFDASGLDCIAWERQSLQSHKGCIWHFPCGTDYDKSYGECCLAKTDIKAATDCVAWERLSMLCVERDCQKATACQLYKHKSVVLDLRTPRPARAPQIPKK
eukprot:4050901-Amphidinium_carterae.1